MANRTSDAEWRGDLKSGQGKIKLGSGAFEGSYSFKSRFEEGKGTNPEELIAAAHAGCFSMASPMPSRRAAMRRLRSIPPRRCSSAPCPAASPSAASIW